MKKSIKKISNPHDFRAISEILEIDPQSLNAIITKDDVKDFSAYQERIKNLNEKQLDKLGKECFNHIAGILSKDTKNKDLRAIKKIIPYSFTYHKSEVDEKNNEDSFNIDYENLTFCISDGATSSPDAKNWSIKITSNTSSCLSDKEKFISKFEEIKKEWVNYWNEEKSKILNSSNDWWTETTLEKANGATYCSITFEKAEKEVDDCKKIKWKALAIGDSCLFHFREGKLLRSFPIDDASFFTDRPKLIKSNSIRESLESESEGLMTYEDEAQRGDTFLLATDAVAEWILKFLVKEESRYEQLKRDILLASNDNSGFKNIILEERNLQTLKDDDSTLIVIGVR